MNNFWNDKQRSDRGEAQWLEKLKGWGYDVYSPTLDQDKKGMDMFAVRNGKVSIFDVKFDGRAHETGNLAFELYSEYPDGRTRDGWASKPVADWLVFIIEQPNKANDYIALKADELNAQLIRLKADQKTIFTSRDRNKRTYSVLCPIDQLENYFTKLRRGTL